MITFWFRVASTRRRFSACRGNRSKKVIEKGGLGCGEDVVADLAGWQLDGQVVVPGLGPHEPIG
jgi:hypothetical protein